MVYLLSTARIGVSSCELARQFGVHQETAWFFKRKVQRALNSFPRAKLKENVEADETLIGGFEPGKPGRSKGNKQLVQVCIEVEYPTHGKRRGKIKNADARVLKDATSNSIKEALDHMVHEKAVITTDGWRGYQKATDRKLHNIEYSEDGANFRELHWHIFTLKNWIRGIHHKISGTHLQSYLTNSTTASTGATTRTNVLQASFQGWHSCRNARIHSWLRFNPLNRTNIFLIATIYKANEIL
jgi:hypothetical protein